MRVSTWLAVATVLMALPVGIGASAVLPPGFAETDVVMVPAPEAFDFAPDGAIWIVQNGLGEGTAIWVYREGNLSYALTFPDPEIYEG